MLETRAIVVHRDVRSTQVRASVASGCSACNGKGCGSGKLTQMFCSKPRQFDVDNRIGAGVGDEVIVSVPEGSVLRGVSLVYLLPLLLMFLGAAAASLAGYGDGLAAAGAVSGLLAGFALAKPLSVRSGQPYIARLYRE